MIRFSNLTIRTLVTLLGFLLLFAALREGRRQVEAADILYLGSRLGSSEARTKELFLSRIPDVMSIQNQGVCRSDLLDAGVAVVMRSLDYLDPVAEYEHWAIVMSDADRFLSHAVGCSPTNGNYWLRLAMIRSESGAPPSEVANLATLSQKYAPAEETLLLARLQLWNRVSAVVLNESRGAVEADIYTICHHSSNAFKRKLPPQGRAMQTFWAATPHGQVSNWCDRQEGKTSVL